MVKKIQIQNFGSFVDFNNTEARFTKGKSIVHGMNGSGKSQLSSLLQYVGRLSTLDSGATEYDLLKKELIEFAIARKSKENEEQIVKVILDDCSISIDTVNQDISISGELPKVYVFDDQYVSRNIGNIVDLPEKPIRIGEKNKIRDQLQDERRKNRTALDSVNDAIDVEVKRVCESTGYATQTRTQKIISKDQYLLRTNPGESHPNARQELTKLDNPPDPITSHLGKTFPELQTSEDARDKLIRLFATKFVEPKLHQEAYKRYVQSNKIFYEHGLNLFRQVSDVCPFCLTQKSQDDEIISELTNYLESEYNSAQNDLNKLRKQVEEYRTRIFSFISYSNKDNDAINRAAKQISSKVVIENIELSEDLLQTSIDLIDSKLLDMGKNEFAVDRLVLELVEDEIGSLRKLYLGKIDQINTINQQIESQIGRKRSLGKEIILDAMYSFWNQNGLRDRLRTLLQEQVTIEDSISKLPAISSGDKSIGFFNQIIRHLGLYKYELNDTSKLILRLNRNHDISSEGFRISTGEKKFIGFSYFLAEVLASVQNTAELGDLSIFIDDPIDSSDYQKFYSFVSVVENIHSLLNTMYHSDEISFGQICIFTHNALLFERLVNTSKFTSYIIALDQNQSVIKTTHGKKALTTFSTYLLTVTDVIKNLDDDHGLELGNYIRRVLEILASVENIDNNKITAINAFPKLNAISNHLSHESIERLLDPLPNSHEYLEACIELIELLKRRVPILYETIKENYLDSIEISEYRSKYEQRYLE